MDGLLFDEATHKYTWNGVVLPSVTQIIGGMRQCSYYGKKVYVVGDIVLNADVVENAADRGSAIHKCATLHLQGKLDQSTVPDEIQGQFWQFLKWCNDFLRVMAPREILTEKRMYSKLHFFAGTCDLILLEPNYIIELKSSRGAAKHAREQTSGYELMVVEHLKVFGFKRAVLILEKGKKYDFYEVGKPMDFKVFLKQLEIFNYFKE